MNAPAKPFLVQALDALRQGDRPLGAQLLAEELRRGDGSVEAIRAVYQLASHISEIDVAIEASRRLVVPTSIESMAAYWGTLTSYGRSAEALEEIERQPPSVRDHPAVLYRRAAAATERGRFEEAQDLFRRIVAKVPTQSAAWLGLAMIKTFDPGDPDIAAMEQLARQLKEPRARANLLYALGKAREDCGDIDAAFGLYEEAGAIKRQLNPFDMDQFRRSADDASAAYSTENLKRLMPSKFVSQRSLFVTGLPRSGTTITEQILLGHSAVADGAEINLFGASIISTLGTRFDDALAYQARGTGEDPWGAIGREYSRLLNMRFPKAGLVVDKSLGQSLLIGLLLHVMPDARIAWLRRSPEDVAISCFRTQFDGGLGWTSSLTDIADYMRIEDRLFHHWRRVFPDRILEVSYEDLAQSPGPWAEKLQAHFGLEAEPRIEQVSRAGRAIKTASVIQAREPITGARIGRAAIFASHLQPFVDRYRSKS